MSEVIETDTRYNVTDSYSYNDYVNGLPNLTTVFVEEIEDDVVKLHEVNNKQGSGEYNSCSIDTFTTLIQAGIVEKS